MNKNLPVPMKEMLKFDKVKQSIMDRIGDKAGTFTTSLIDLCGDNPLLAECDPKLVIKEALKAAALDLPINANLGFAYVIPYKKKGVPEPSFQMGAKGYLQLAIRTGQYKHLNAGTVYEGEEIVEDRIKGTLKIKGKKTSDKAIGYFCYFELLNGFNKGLAWTKERVKAHGKKYSKSFTSKYSPWQTDFNSMAKKTMVLQLIPKYGVMTIEMSQAMRNDMGDFKGFQGSVEAEVEENANTETIDITPETLTDAEKEDIKKDEAKEGPGY